MRIVISGASGLIGTALTQRLSADGHTTVRLVRRPAQHGEASWDPHSGRLDPAVLEDCDAVVNLSGAGIGDRRWTDEYKRELLSSRIEGTGLLANTMASLDHPPAVFISGSAIGWYGDRGDEDLDESSPPGSDFLSDLCQRWEAATAPAERAGIRTVHIRTGIVLSRRGGSLKKQLPLFKLGIGGRFGSGRQWQSWISIDDEVGAICHLLSADVGGPVNLTAPNPVTNAEFTTTLGNVLHRPTLVPTPMLAPKLLFGAELANTLLLSSQRVHPAKLSASGYEFRQATLDAALHAVLGR
ncbi:MAG TPA: TIGR01777 family oxidoreductase [Ilumatobacteraceae bacterium]|nr:TIGR01777 family oxidoreductase [Ilumatobacteraceae bacterium]